MNWPAECAVVIPCLNEQATIGSLVRAVRRHLPTVLMVDDGSSDETALRAGEAGAVVLRHDRTRGKGAALTTGWRAARERGFSWGLCLDGDGQHAPEDIPAFLACGGSTGAALVVGNRMRAPEGMPWVRRTANRWMSRMLSRRLGRELPDSQCGFRLMNLEQWRRLPISGAHFEIESDVLLAFAAAGLDIRFVPIQVIYKREQSKIHPFLDTLRWFRWYSRTRNPLAPETPLRGSVGGLAVEGGGAPRENRQV
jgi:glycosyltransferase involved in cell wall biosynthesis